MGIVRLLVRVGILALFGLAAVVAMAVLFGVQIRFDQQAELQMRGLDGPETTTIVTVVTGSSAKAGQELASSVSREAPRSNDTPVGGGAVSWNATASVRPLVLMPEQVDELMGSPAPQAEPLKAEPAPDQDSRFTSVRIFRPGAEPSIHRVPKER